MRREPDLHYDFSVRNMAAYTKHIGIKFCLVCDLIGKKFYRDRILFSKRNDG